MSPGFQEGRRPRANTVASLAATGHVSPLARRPGLSTAPPAHRPGPQPLSAGRLAAANAAHAQTKRAVSQVVQLTKQEVWRLNSDAQLRRRMETMPYARYNANKTDPRTKTDVVDEYGNPLGQERYAVGQLWVFASTINDAYGTRRYWVYNTETKVLVSFEPEHGLAAKNRSYMPEGDSFRNMAAGTGVVGGYLEKGFIAIAGGMASFGLVYEVGGVAVVGTAIRAYAVKAAEQAGARVLIDLSTQFGVGTVTGKGTLGQRARASFADINWMSAAGAAVVNTEGLQWCGKLLAAFGTSAVTNAYSLKFGNQTKYHQFGHVVDLNDQQESKEFVVNVVLGTAFDQLKEYGAPWMEKVMRNTPNTGGMMTALKYHRVALPTPALNKVDQTMVGVISYELGATLETGKKLVENFFADKKETADNAAKAKAAAARHLPVRR